MKKAIANWLRRRAYRLDPVTHIELLQVKAPFIDNLPKFSGMPRYYETLKPPGTFRVWPEPDGDVRLSYKVGP